MHVVQDWVATLNLATQATLLTAIRGPDNAPKDCPAKVIVRAFRRTVLIAARGKRVYDFWSHLDGEFMRAVPYEGGTMTKENTWRAACKAYFRTTDELPHHFQMHLLHAAQICAYCHPKVTNDGFAKANYWLMFYSMGCDDMHLPVEPMDVMHARYAAIGDA